MTSKSNLELHAERELEILGMSNSDDEMEKGLFNHVLEMIRIFADEGHTGFTAGYTVNILQRLLRFEPLTPLTGEDDEWSEIIEGQWQNKRCSHVFKDRNGKAYDIDGKVFRQKDGSCYTNHESRVSVEFPYVPKTEYVDDL